MPSEQRTHLTKDTTAFVLKDSINNEEAHQLDEVTSENPVKSTSYSVTVPHKKGEELFLFL